MNKEKCFICDSEMRHLTKFPDEIGVYKCSNCNLRGLRPLPDISKIINFYDRYEYYNEEIADLHNDLVVGYDENLPIINLYKKHIKNISLIKNPPAKLLEIGCARGVFLHLATKMGYETIGMEMNAHAYEYGIKNFNLNILKNSIEEVDFTANSFDIIVALDVIEHIINPEILIKNAFKFLKPGGVLLIGTPNSNSLVNNVAEFSSILTKGLYNYPLYRFYGRGCEHLNIFNPHNIAILLKKYNFKLKTKYLYNIPLNNMCDVNIFYKTAIRLITIIPYEFIIIAIKEEGDK